MCSAQTHTQSIHTYETMSTSSLCSDKSFLWRHPAAVQQPNTMCTLISHAFPPCDITVSATTTPHNPVTLCTVLAHRHQNYNVFSKLWTNKRGRKSQSTRWCPADFTASVVKVWWSISLWSGQTFWNCSKPASEELLHHVGFGNTISVRNALGAPCSNTDKNQ